MKVGRIFDIVGSRLGALPLGSSRSWHTLSLAAARAGALAALAACSGIVTPDGSASTTEEIRALRASEIVGVIRYGESRDVVHDGIGHFRALKFEGRAGDVVDLSVSSTSAEPMVWIADAGYVDQATSSNNSLVEHTARLNVTLRSTGTFYIALRDEQHRPGTFSVNLTGSSNPVSSIAIGHQSSCALRQNGNISCWGTRMPSEASAHPAHPQRYDSWPLSATDPPRAITSGTLFACALRQSGKVRCWGQRDVGTPLEWPHEASDLALPGPAKQISASTYVLCAVLEDGHVSCWGEMVGAENNYGLYSTMDLGTGIKAASIATGHRFACAVLTDGRVKCFGVNGSGQLGLGDTRDRGQPYNPDQEEPTMGDALPFVPFGARVRSISAGWTHACAVLESGAVRCWGDGANGRLGTTTIAVGDEPGEAPVDVALPGPATAVRAGARHTCALLADGRLFCWGANDKGQLGTAGRTDSATPVVVPLDSVKEVGLALDGTCAHVTAGAVICWGDNTQGQLGLRFASAYDLNLTAPIRDRHVLDLGY